MSLRVYNSKRRFTETPEPKGKRPSAKGRGPLRFVVQMHDATRLHFDFRLEFGGVFKSWAVPKGPSLNPQDQRLAVFVEDHPLEYGSFEGIIPKGNYGAGTVMIWDEGTYVERGSEDRKDSEAAMLHNFKKGHLTFVLDGHKLKGEFALIQLKKDKGEKAWLLVKKRDAHSTYKTRASLNNESAKTGRSIEQIAAQAEKKGDVWLPKKGKVTLVKSKPPVKSKSVVGKATLKPQAVPRKVKPMIATLSRVAPPKTWLLEPKVDGLRAIAEVEGHRVSLYSKGGLSFNSKHASIVEALKELDVTAVFDGEIVGTKYCISDLLYWQDRDLRQETLRKRKALLKTAFRNGKHLQHVEAGKAKTQIAKNPESVYKSGTSSDWQIVSAAAKASAPAVSTTDDGPRLTHLDKIYFPDDRLTKGDLLDYYEKVSAYILPYLKDRPESLNRFPNGITKAGFYQKDVTGHIPRWLKTHRLYSESAAKSIDYLLCQDQRALLYMVNLGCIEINPWFSRVGHLDEPDFLVIDLDPDGNSFDQVMDIAHEVHEILDAIGALNVCKTSGATGIHIGVPLQAKYSFDEARAFAERVCKVVARNHPAVTSMDRNPARRRKKIYLDYMQNRRGQTLAAPYCVRPRRGAPVSMPLTWRELKQGLKPGDFNLRNALSRMQKGSDPWSKILGPPVDLTKCAKLLQKKYFKD